MKQNWWKEAVVYQIYPRSFMDANGDGIGDLAGIISKLDYLKALGVTVLWLSPIYPSPNDDNGYDISDYRDIMAEFGTLDDFKKLLTEAHKRGLRILMDLVVNHTSDEHFWFTQSRLSKDNLYRDYYIWRDGKNGGLPNNWESFFSGSAWEYDVATEQYYLHLFSKKQPDLNWENPAVRREIYDMMNYWLDMGIDGFRMDTVNIYSKAEGLPDMPGEGLQFAGEMFFNGPHIHDYIQEMNRESLCKYDIMSVGEACGVTPEEAMKYVSEEAKELNMVFQFEHMGLDYGDGKWDALPYEPKKLKDNMIRWQSGFLEDGWNSQYLNNHDQPRQVSRFGNDKEYWSQSAKMLATMLHTLSGTPFVYQGEELGMTNVRFENMSDYRDIETLNVWAERSGDDPSSCAKLFEVIKERSRDNARTPMQWTDEPNAGFSAGKPWIKVNPNYRTINAQQQLDDKDSIFSFYKKLIALRKAHKVLVYGKFQNLDGAHSKVFCYARQLGKEKLVIVLNMTGEQISYRMPDEGLLSAYKVMISNYPHADLVPQMRLNPYQAIVFQTV